MNTLQETENTDNNAAILVANHSKSFRDYY